MIAAALTLAVCMATLVLEPEQSVQIPACDHRDKQADRLEQFHESQMAWKILPSGGLLELWSSPEGTWTIIETTPDGLSCIVQVGDGAVLRWQQT